MAGIVAYLAALAVFLIVDAAWLSLVAVDVFRSVVGSVLREQPSLGAALAFYLVYAFGMVWLVILPALRVQSARAAAVGGAVLGLTAYATFDLTALTIIKDWTLGLALFDMAWGTVVTAIGCLAGFEAARRYAPARTALTS